LDNVLIPVDGLLAAARLATGERAEAMLAAVAERLSENAEAACFYAQLAEVRLDWDDALARWNVVIASFRDLPDGYCGATRALMELGRFDEAKALIATAVALFPDHFVTACTAGWVATRRRCLGEAEIAWGRVRERFPAEPVGHVGWAKALRDDGRLAEAEAVLREAAPKFPDDPDIAADLAQISADRRDWPVAILRWEEALQQFPDWARPYIGLGEALTASGAVAEAKAVFEAGEQRCPDDFHLAAAHADAAAAIDGLDAATARWSRLIATFPRNPYGYIGISRTLREAGQFDASLDWLNRALLTFPDNFDLELQRAMTLGERRDWRAALPLLASLKQRHPDNGAVRSQIAHVMWQARQDHLVQADDPAASFEIPAELLDGADAPAAAADQKPPLKALLLRFESIGDTCEFGMVQRRFGAEPLSLLRWTSTAPDDLVTALNTDFAGVGEPDHTIIEIVNGEFTTRDDRYYMFSHTFTAATAETIEAFSAQHLRRMQFLRRKFLDDLKAAKKLLVYKCDQGVTDEQALALYRALRRFNPDNALLCVRLATADRLPGTMEQADERLFLGSIDKFSTVDISYGHWVNLCHQVAARVPAAG
jgi:tetratricopeptide (TPR) repeat protein